VADTTIRDRIVSWLASAGFIVAPADQGLPSAAQWGIMVSTPPPIQVRLRLMGLRSGLVVAGIGVNFSDVHKRELQRLEPAERSAFVAQLSSKIMLLCPMCRIALHGGLVNPEAIVAEIVYDPDNLTKQRLIDDMARLVNVFMLINMELWSRFPEAHIEAAKSQGGGTSFM
jgi:hypothetical protein